MLERELLSGRGGGARFGILFHFQMASLLGAAECHAGIAVTHDDEQPTRQTGGCRQPPTPTDSFATRPCPNRGAMVAQSGSGKHSPRRGFWRSGGPAAMLAGEEAVEVPPSQLEDDPQSG